MKVVLWGLIAGLLIKMAISLMIAHVFPLPHPDRPAWNTAKEEALARAAAAEERVSP